MTKKLSPAMEAQLINLAQVGPNHYLSHDDPTCRALERRGLVERCLVRNPNPGMSAWKLGAWRTTRRARAELARIQERAYANVG